MRLKQTKQCNTLILEKTKRLNQVTAVSWFARIYHQSTMTMCKCSLWSAIRSKSLQRCLKLSTTASSIKSRGIQTSPSSAPESGSKVLMANLDSMSGRPTLKSTSKSIKLARRSRGSIYARISRLRVGMIGASSGCGPRTGPSGPRHSLPASSSVSPSSASTIQ